jgi:uncharacterized protein
MSAQENVETVKKFFAALRGGDTQGLLAVSAEDIEWIVPGKGWPLAGTHRGHAELTDLLQKASETVETSYPTPFEFVAQGDRVLVIGFATGKMLATDKAFEDDWVFSITVQNGKLKSIREYVDTQAVAEASEVTGDSTGNEEIIKKLYAAGERPGLDPEKFVSFFSEEGYMWDMASGTKFRGKAIGDSIAALASAFPDVRREISSIDVAGNVVIVEHRIRGTHDGELAIGSKTVAPTGKVIDVPSADIFRLENGKIVAFDCYHLPSVMQQQLGLADG